MHCVPLPQHLYLEGEVCEKVIQNSTGMKQHLEENSFQTYSIQMRDSFCCIIVPSPLHNFEDLLKKTF